MITVKMKNDRDALQCCRGPELMMADYCVNMRAKWTLEKKERKKKRLDGRDQKRINDGSFQTKK
jgi:hypothetical protein